MCFVGNNSGRSATLSLSPNVRGPPIFLPKVPLNFAVLMSGPPWWGPGPSAQRQRLESWVVCTQSDGTPEVFGTCQAQRIESWVGQGRCPEAPLERGVLLGRDSGAWIPGGGSGPPHRCSSGPRDTQLFHLNFTSFFCFLSFHLNRATRASPNMDFNLSHSDGKKSEGSPPF